MKCPDCGHVAHPDGECNTVGCSCTSSASAPMSAVEMRALSVDDFERAHAALAAVVPPDLVGEPGASGDSGAPVTDADLPGTQQTDTPGPTDATPGGDTDGTMDGPAWRIPVGLVEGLMTADGRQLADGATTWRETPFPLMAIDKTTFAHDQAEIAGRVDRVGREGNVIWAEGVFLANDRGTYYAGLVAEQFIKGVSADLTDVVEDIVVTAVDDDGFPAEIGSQFTQAKIAGFTIVPFPAFEGAYIMLVSEEAETTVEPTLEQPNAEQAAAGLHVLASEHRCSACDESTALVAAAGPMYPPREWFENPGFDGPTKLSIDDDGRISGHLAVFGTCHIGMSGKCVTPFRSETGYSQFATGSTLTAEGDLVATGVITMDTGHADVNPKLTASQVRRHYDDTGTAAADVAMGHDDFGIWITGAMRPDVTELQVRKLRGSALSGDWRWIGAGMEVVAALAVNVPGFPVVQAVAASGHPVAMVAAGGLPLAMISEAAAGGSTNELAKRIEVLERVVSLSLDNAKANLRQRMAALTA